MQYHISVVIIAYNTANYIKTCLDSVFSQNFKNFEIIIVDNASTDGTADIIKDYTAEKSNVVFIENDKNLGGAIAGNMGIQKAQGEYVFIMDSDDIMPEGTLKALYRCAQKNHSDIVIGRAKILFSNTVRNLKFKLYSIPYCLTGTYKNLYECKELLISPFYWGRLYRTELLRKNDIYMPENFVFADMYLNSKALKCAKNITVCEHLSYIWRRFEEKDAHVSITSTENQTKTFADRLQSYYDLEQLFSDPSDSEILKNIRMYNLLRLLILTKFTANNSSFAKLYFEEMYGYLEKISYDEIKDCIYMTSKKKLLCYLIKEKRFDEFVEFSNPKYKFKTKVKGKYAVIIGKSRPHDVPLDFLRHVVRKPEECTFRNINRILNYYKFTFDIDTPPKNKFSVLRAVLLDENGNEIHFSQVHSNLKAEHLKNFSFYIPKKVFDSFSENMQYSINAEMLFNNNFCSTSLTYEKEKLIIQKSKKRITLNGNTIQKYQK